VRVAHVEPVTSAEGPELRWALWVQGCSLGCPGCCNPHLWDAAGGTATSVDDLVRAMRAVSDVVEGITLLGGEPFEQAEPLAEIAAAAHDQGLGVMTFTGYRVEHIRGSAIAGWQALLATTDLLVDGLFLRDRVDTARPWVGSTNQRFIHLTDRYRDAALGTHDRVEIRVRRDGAVAINGWPEPSLVSSLEDLIDDI
jgi:anaerobic ribonucleoside-triphosphate reductase activating protein